ncbi:MAG: hypothetical protein QM756_42810 [Polyangiaceae bacterium]
MSGRGAALTLSVAALLCSEHARAQAAEVVVKASPRRAPPSEASLSGESARELAGTQGDAVKATQNLPGFGRGGAASEPIAWGAPPRDTRILVDGVEVPLLYHGSGIRSVVPTEQVLALHGSPGAYDARFGRAVGGLVRVVTAAPDVVEARYVAHADLLDAGAYVSKPLVVGTSAVALSGRYGYVERWFSGLVSPALRGSLYVIPAYWDAHAEFTNGFNGGAKARYVLRVSSDQADSVVGSSDPARTRAELRGTRFARLYGEHVFSLADGSAASITPFVGWDDTSFESRTGDSGARLSVRALRYGLRASTRILVAPKLSFELGVDGIGAASQVQRRGSLSIPRREGDPWPFGTQPEGALVSDDYRTHQLELAPFLQTELSLRSLRLEPGLRVNAALGEVSRGYPSVPGAPDTGSSTIEALLEPRLSATLQLSQRATLFAAAGRYHQLPRPEDLGAVAGNPKLAAVTATHVVVGERLQVASGLELEVRAYGRRVTHVSVRNPALDPELARSLLDNGHARSFGSEVTLRARSLAGVEGWLTLSVSRSEQLESNGARFRLSDWDAPFSLTAVAKRRIGGFAVSSRLRWTSGNPRTPVVDVFENVSSGRTVPVFGVLNSQRLPSFFQLDLRIDRPFALDAETLLNVYLDLLNVTAHPNVEDIVYSSDFKSSAWLSGLPPMAIAGIRLER